MDKHTKAKRLLDWIRSNYNLAMGYSNPNAKKLVSEYISWLQDDNLPVTEIERAEIAEIQRDLERISQFIDRRPNSKN